MRKLTLVARQKFLEKKLKIKLEKMTQFALDPEKIAKRNCENLIGAVQIPVGIAGPMKIKSSIIKPSSQDSFEMHKSSIYYLPLATTEGALVASVNRGCKATRLAGGITVLAEDIGATRAPVFRVKNLSHGQKLIVWAEKNLPVLKKLVAKTDPYLELKAVQPFLLGRNVYLRFIFNTFEAMGMNMVTKASGAMTALIEKENKAKCIAVTGNLCTDKKLAWQNFILGRGKKVWAEAEIKREIIKKELKTTPGKIVEVVYRKCLVGSALSGSLGFNSHFANIVAALFLATGQDMAQVVEGSLGMTTAEILNNGSLYFAVYLPDLMIGTVGGGTGLPAQKEALSILGLGQGKQGEVMEFAKIIGGAVLCGELSLVAALSAGHLVKAHEELGRGKTC